jgi:hypothetical protein
MLGEWYDEDAIRIVPVGRGCALADGRHFLVLSVELWLEAIVVQYALRRVPGSSGESPLSLLEISLVDDTGFAYTAIAPSAFELEVLPLAAEPGAVTRFAREFSPSLRVDVASLRVAPEGGSTIPVDLF